MTQRPTLPGRICGAVIPCAALALAACAPAPGGSAQAPDPGDCLSLNARDWAAWINRMPGPGGEANRLIVTGEVQYPAAGYAAELVLDRVIETAPPVLVLQLVETPPDGPSAQVLTWTGARYEAPADGQGYAAVQIECGPEAIAEISPVESVY